MEVTDHFLSKERFELVYDQELKAYKTTPAPVNLTAYYNASNYYSHNNKGLSLIERLYGVAKRFRNRQKWKLVTRAINVSDRPINALDFGSGDGSFVAAAPARVDAFGVDPLSPKNATFKTLEAAKTQTRRYDIITAWHSLEHTHNPKEILSAMVELLKEGGRIHIAVPNYKSWDAQHYGHFWAGYDVPRHLWHFSKESLELLAVQLDLEVVKIRPHWFDAFYVSYLSETYKGRPNPLLKSAYVTAKALFTLKALKQPSALYFQLKKAK